MAAPVDLRGRRFGKLVAVRATDQRRSNSVVWECRCDCGNTVLRSAKVLKAGGSVSCGCAKQTNMADLSGKRFGMLTAIRPTGKRKGRSVVWACRCDCGNEIEAPADMLVSGQRVSCGCKRSAEIADVGKSLVVEGTKPCVFNGKARADSSTGIRGVQFDRRNGMFYATLTFQGKRHWLGSFSSIQDAANARREAEEDIVDPWLIAHGYPPTDEAEFQEQVAEGLRREGEREGDG